MCIYFSEFLWRWKLSRGANDDVSNTKWTQLEPAGQDNREYSHKHIYHNICTRTTYKHY